MVYCLNKIDSISIEELDLLYRIPNAVPISSEHGWNIDELMESMWEKLSLKRVYTKPKGRQPDYSAPVVLRASRCTVEDFVSNRNPLQMDKRHPLCALLFTNMRYTTFSAMPFIVALWNNSSQPLFMASR